MMSNDVVDVYVCTGRVDSKHPPANAGSIQLYRLSLINGSLTPSAFTSETSSTGHLALHPDGRHLYSLHGLREFNGQPGSAVGAFNIDPDSGTLDLLNMQAAQGLWPSYIAITPSGHSLVAVNYGTGNVVLLPILVDGSLGEASDMVQHTGSSVNPERQGGPHAHCVVLDPSGRYALVADLGLDQIVSYRLDERLLHPAGTLSVRPGSGPRHLAYDPGGQYLYCTNELDSTLSVFAGKIAENTLREIYNVSTVPGDFEGRNSPAHLQFAPSGRTLYVLSRA